MNSAPNVAAQKHRTGADAVAAKGWLGAHKWLLARRCSQLGILALFLLGPLAGVWIVKGNLAYSLTLGVLPLTDPYVLLQSLLAGHVPEKLALIGAAVVAVFYFFVGGRVYCAWVCPLNLVTDFAGWLRGRLGIKGSAHISRERHDRLGADQSGIDAAPRADLRDRRRVGGGAGGFSVRPVRDESRLVRPSLPGRRLLQPARQAESAARFGGSAQRLQ